MSVCHIAAQNSNNIHGKTKVSIIAVFLYRVHAADLHYTALIFYPDICFVYKTKEFSPAVLDEERLFIPRTSR